MEIEEQKESPISHLIPDEIKWAIVFLKKDNMANKAVARRITEDYGRQMNHQTVKRIWESYKENDSISPKWSAQGRPKSLNDEDLERLAQNCLDDRIISVRERRQELELE